MYNFNLHKEKCKEKQTKEKQTFVRKSCSEEFNNSHNLKLHEEKCNKAQKLICKTCSKKLDHWHKLNERETKCKKKYNETKITYKCSICSKVFDNKSNLLQHEKACKKHCATVKGRKKQKKDHHKATLMKQVQSKYDTILNEENIITQKLKTD